MFKKKRAVIIIILLVFIGGFYMVFKNNLSQPLITFVCTGNTGRSPMAAYLAQHFKLGEYQVNSRGVRVRPSEITPESNAIVVMKDMNIDINMHRAKQLTMTDVNQAKLVLTMTKAQKATILATIAPTAKNVYMLSECADGTQTDIPDAYNQNLEFYRETRDKIKKYIQEISERDGNCHSNSV